MSIETAILVRTLWLLSLDDAAGTIAKAFDNYKGEIPTWYWIRRRSRRC
jgi:transformation/transcription domain-associated protein